MAVIGRFWGRVETDEEIVDAAMHSGVILLMDHLVAAAEAGQAIVT
jgi:hypothetical protein